MPRFYCDFCDAYLTHDSVSTAVDQQLVLTQSCCNTDAHTAGLIMFQRLLHHDACL
jgi:hypothetical protein